MISNMTQSHLSKLVDHLFPGAALNASERLTGGVSADVYRLDLTLMGGINRSIVVRLHGETHAGHPARLEYALLRALADTEVPVPEVLFADDSGQVLTAPFVTLAFVAGTTAITRINSTWQIKKMADMLLKIHDCPTRDLPDLPLRIDPRPGLFDFLPETPVTERLRSALLALPDTAYKAPPKLVHGDFWPENLLWQNQQISAVLDWEDAALGDPLSDVATAQLELRYKFGKETARRFVTAYAINTSLDTGRLALWQVYVAAAAYTYMGEWRLAPDIEAHMRKEALASLVEAGENLIARTQQ